MRQVVAACVISLLSIKAFSYYNAFSDEDDDLLAEVVGTVAGEAEPEACPVARRGAEAAAGHGGADGGAQALAPILLAGGQQGIALRHVVVDGLPVHGLGAAF